MVWRSTRARNLLNSDCTSNGQLITDYGYGSSEQESSEGEFVEAEKPWPPVDLSRASRSRTKTAGLHIPRPHSHLFIRPDGRTRGSKHTRRWENCKHVCLEDGACVQWVELTLPNMLANTHACSNVLDFSSPNPRRGVRGLEHLTRALVTTHTTAQLGQVYAGVC